MQSILGSVEGRADRISRLCVTPRGDAYAYSCFLQLLDPHVVTGLA